MSNSSLIDKAPPFFTFFRVKEDIVFWSLGNIWRNSFSTNFLLSRGHDVEDIFWIICFRVVV
ncbi:hypothetical protein A2U01_0072098, partial [Trifolium medium]|nr:hypothetical protein [Trifolium medium]